MEHGLSGGPRTLVTQVPPGGRKAVRSGWDLRCWRRLDPTDMPNPVRFIDRLLRRFEHIEDFTEDPACLFRLEKRQATPQMAVLTGEIVAGTDVLALHYWNERLPLMTNGKPDLAWANRLYKEVSHSLVILGQHVEAEPEFDATTAVVGIVAFLSPAQAQTGKRLLQRLGFSSVPYRSASGAVSEFWERLYVWWLCRAFSSNTTRHQALGDLRRAFLWMPRERFIERYGNGAVERSEQGH